MIEPDDINPDNYMSQRRQLELEEMAQCGMALSAIRCAIREAIAARIGNYVQPHRQCP